MEMRFMFSQMHADQSIKQSAKPLFLPVCMEGASRYKAWSINMWGGVKFQQDVVNDNSSLIAKGQNSLFCSYVGVAANLESIYFLENVSDTK